ncbi:HGGxSTG domain-containing protein [Pseudoalteromonas sp. Xi13]|uniref:HGGxSTG domain-containing protein n=1 Tax=Pseudoalteromonas sp. Xi13 TaxID=2490635 RepID=UPI000F74F6F4|nr:HGGxSTG domain-containing protein [Pseudoalteromonas sp. Xi13]AZN33969.1 hypothetical protein EJ103_15045 [Pseudoalteromonas sp. Xi13]
MSKFDLDSLPKCGAKTRSGNPCKRLGNKRNGRCKLHGGRSTGAKTTEGKLAVRTNPVKNGFGWNLMKDYDPVLIEDSLKAYIQLCDIVELKGINNREVNELVARHKVALECFKYRVLECYGVDSFIIIQSALDAYYKDTDSQHLHFHIHTKVVKAPYFHQHMSEARKQSLLINKAFKFNW